MDSYLLEVSKFDYKYYNIFIFINMFYFVFIVGDTFSK